MTELILGDNQFLGVNHRSEELGRQSSSKFGDKSQIFRFLAECKDLGICSFMFTTHEKILPVLEDIGGSKQFENYSLYPCLPYAHKYADSVTENGVLKTITQFSYANLFSFMCNGVNGLLTGNAKYIMKSLVDAELEKIPAHLLKCVYLQNLVTDLLLGLGMEDLLLEFAEHITRKYGIEVGFVTMNYPLLCEKLAKSDPNFSYRVCTNVNKNGFRMNPSKEIVLNTLGNESNHVTAMSIFASGSLQPEEAIKFITGTLGLDACLFGSSQIKNIKTNISYFKNYNK
jgi:hypothetical protein